MGFGLSRRKALLLLYYGAPVVLYLIWKIELSFEPICFLNVFLKTRCDFDDLGTGTECIFTLNFKSQAALLGLRGTTNGSLGSHMEAGQICLKTVG